MMKKLFLLVIGFVMFKMGYAQYPIQQFIGADSAIVTSKGAMQSRFVNVVFADTTAANSQRIKQYPGAMIYASGKMWVRNTTATAWVELAYGPISSTNIYNSNGSLTSNRTLDGGGYSLTFDQIGGEFAVGSDSVNFSTSSGKFRADINAGNGTKALRYDPVSRLFGYTDTTSLSGYVPYLGATQNVNLGQYGLKTEYVEFDTTLRAPADRTLSWNNDEGTLNLGMTNGGSITQRIGLEQFARVRNVDTATISIGDAVYVFGASGDRASVKRASNKSDATSSKTLGVAAENIPIGDVGFVGTFGVVEKLNLGSFTAGDILYLDSIPGQLTTTKPQAPYHMVFVGIVERANNGNGLLFVNPQNGYELEELHNVRITSPVRNNAILAYDSVASLWKDTTLAGIGGVTGTGTTNYLSKWTGSTALGNSLVYDDGTGVGVKTTTLATNANLTIGPFGTGTDGKITIQGRTNDNNWLGRIEFVNNSGSFVNQIYNSSNGMFFSVNAADRMIISRTTGNVLINTSIDGGEKLRVNGGAIIIGTLDIQGTIRVPTAYQANPLQLYKAYNSTNALIEFYGGTGSKLVYSTNTRILYPETNAGVSLGTSSLKFNNIYGTKGYFSDTVGIGTTSPSYKLDISGTARFTNALWMYSVNTADDIINFHTGSTYIKRPVSTTEFHIGNSLGSGIQFFTSAERMRLTNGGNVLIGTTTDGGYKLSVNGTAQINGALTFASTATKIETQVSTSTYLLLTPSTGLKISNDSWVPSGTASGTTGYIYNTNNQKIFQNDPNTTASSDGYLFRYRIQATGSVAGLTHNGILLSRDILNTAAQTYVGIRSRQQDNSVSIANTLIGIYSDVSLGSNTSANRYSGIFMGGAMGIGTTSPDASALLDITSTTKGFLPPRMTGAEAEAIATPAAGLMVYANNGNGTTITSIGWWGYDGTNWVKLN